MAERGPNRWVFWALGALAIGLVLFTLWRRQPVKAPAKAPIVAVAVASVTRKDIQVTLEAIGAAQAWRSVTVLPQVSGTLKSVHFREGSEVKAGDLLAEIDPAPYRAALTQAQGALNRDQALLAQAKLDLARYRTLSAQDSIARQTYDAQRALVRQDEGIVMIDQGAVAAAKVNLDRCRILSPLSGRTGVRLTDPGNLVSASGTSNATNGAAATSAGTSGSITGGVSGTNGIVVINQIDPIAVTFTVPQGDFPRVQAASQGFKKPLSVEVRSQETGETLATGVLRIVDNKVDPSTATVQLKGEARNQTRRLWPGQFVNVRLKVDKLSNVLVIPAGAVNEGPGGPFAYVVDGAAKAAVRPLKIGPRQDGVAVVLSGLTEGETVVVDGQMTLRPGAAVKVRPAAAGGAA
jgi:multidrug efflux system membrane fusion protein